MLLTWYVVSQKELIAVSPHGDRDSTMEWARLPLSRVAMRGTSMMRTFFPALFAVALLGMSIAVAENIKVDDITLQFTVHGSAGS